MKANYDKCHPSLSTQDEANIANETIKSSSAKEILGITVDSKVTQSTSFYMMGTLAFNMLTFDRHVGNFCKKASRKLNALVN